MSKTVFRIDDIGASTKHFNQYGKHWITVAGKKLIPVPFSDFWFFKRIPLLRGWAKYDELTTDEWEKFLAIFSEHGIVPIVAITACWVERDGTLVPFPEKFPQQASLLKKAWQDGKIIVANHGLTHCIVGKHLPKIWGSNRKFHREFFPELDQAWHDDHIMRSQEILESFFEKRVEIFVPPGNVWSVKTYQVLKRTNIQTVMCARYMADSMADMEGIKFIPDHEGVCAFHDRELKLFGVSWLKRIIQQVWQRQQNK